MQAPVVPDTTIGEWSVTHCDGHSLNQHAPRQAFTSRKAGLGALPLMPNEDTIVIDEAWSLKFSTKCPEMTSAQDGQRLLMELLRGRPNRIQRGLYQHGWMAPPSTRDPALWLVRVEHSIHTYQDYIRADTWSPDGITDDRGRIQPYQQSDTPMHHCLAVGLTSEFFTGATGGVVLRTLHANMEVMLFPFRSGHCWNKNSYRREAPGYLSC